MYMFLNSWNDSICNKLLSFLYLSDSYMVDVDKKKLVGHPLDLKRQKIVLLRIELRTFSESIQPCEREIITIRPQNYSRPKSDILKSQYVSDC